jgi:hypothetical protein
LTAGCVLGQVEVVKDAVAFVCVSSDYDRTLFESALVEEVDGQVGEEIAVDYL